MTDTATPPLEQKLLRDDILLHSAAGWTLAGSRCACGHISFPPVNTCPECLGDLIETVELPKTGTIFACTTVRMPAANFKPPYSIGYVDLSGGPRVFAHFQMGQEMLKIGAPVRLQVKPLWEEHGRPVVAYCFVGFDRAPDA